MSAANAAVTAGRPMVGIAIAALAVLSFAFGDTLTKTLAERFPVPSIMGVRYWLNVALLVAILGPRHGSGLWRTNRTALVIARGGVLAMASVAMGYALKLIPVGEATSIVYLSPIVVILLAAPVLGEKPTRITMIGAAFGFCGVLLIARPGSGLVLAGVIYALINVGLTSTYHLTTRLLARTETAVAMQVISALVGALVFTPFLFADAGLSALSLEEAGLFLGLALAMTAGHYLFTLAYREAPATLIAPFTYLQLFWAVGFGWLIFGHVPDWITATGIGLIAASGAAIAASGHLMGRRRAARRAARALPSGAVVDDRDDPKT